MDILCAKCGEPWDSYSVYHEMNSHEQAIFLRGQGCEACDFGKSCPECAATGKRRADRYEPGCEHCLGQRYLIIRQPCDTPTPQVWQFGYQPKVAAIRDPRIIRTYPIEESLDGPYRRAKALCPFCREEASQCQACHGSGQLIDLTDGAFKAAASEVEASDEDPILILQRRGLL